MTISAIKRENARKIKLLELHSKRLLRGGLIGGSRSAIKGGGFEFDQIREYQIGDDVRFIDWNASARMNELLVKEYVEERSRTVIVAVDISSSSFFGSGSELKYDLITQIAGILALVANRTHDRVGLMLFSDEVELYIPPRDGAIHTRFVLDKLLSARIQSRGLSHKASTNFELVFKKLAKIACKDAMLFLISDFIGSFNATYLKLMGTLYDVIAIRCLDKNESQIPAVGFVTVKDIETGELMMLDTREKSGVHLKDFLMQRLRAQNKVFKRSGITVLDVLTNKPFMNDLIGLFKRRGHR